MSKLASAETLIAHGSSLILDLVSTGSRTRLDYLEAQKTTFGSHKGVRHFIAITEEDDTEQECWKELTEHDAIKICDYCQDKQRNNRLEVEHPFLAQKSKHFGIWTKSYQSPGWLCAQKRPNDGLQKALRQYQQNHTELPDYLIIMDDDTYINTGSVVKYLNATYNSTVPVVIAGCLFGHWKNWTHQWGGWSTLISKGALQNLVRPIDCNLRQEDEFTEAACRRLHVDLFGERRHFKNGMSVGQLIHAYVTAEKYINYKNWTDRGFCLHSDHVWGYFFNFYIDTKQNWMHSYQESVYPSGQCNFIGKNCTTESHICHYVGPKHMHAVYEEIQNRP
jgi:hypothetical protein